MDDEVLPAEPRAKLDIKAFMKTSTLSYISRASSLSAPNNIFLQGACVIQAQVVVRADLAKISLGRCCYVGRATVLRPPSNVFSWGVGFLPLTVGSGVVFGDECVVRAASIGSGVRVGHRVVLGERCILKDFCEILDDAVVPPDTVIAPYTCWGGNPCRLVKMLPESFGIMAEWEAEELFTSLTQP